MGQNKIKMKASGSVPDGDFAALSLAPICAIPHMCLLCFSPLSLPVLCDFPLHSNRLSLGLSKQTTTLPCFKLFNGCPLPFTQVQAP